MIQTFEAGDIIYCEKNRSRGMVREVSEHRDEAGRILSQFRLLVKLDNMGCPVIYSAPEFKNLKLVREACRGSSQCQ